MKKYLKCFSVLLALLLIAQFALPVTAHEYYPTPFYFGELTRPSTGMVQLEYRFQYATTTRSSTYRSYARAALNAWINACPRINPMEFSSSSAGGINFYDSWPSSLPERAFGACAIYTEDANIVKWKTAWSGVNSIDSVKRITSSPIYINVVNQTDWGFSANQCIDTYLHEIAHSLGFDETTDGTVSVTDDIWSAYTSPRSHDISDFNNIGHLYKLKQNTEKGGIMEIKKGARKL